MTTQLREVTVGSLLEAAAHHHPDRPALQWPTRAGLASLTWQQVHRRATAAAARLRSCSNPTAPVAVWAPNSDGWYVSLWAVALSGRPLVPINPALTESELVTVLTDCGASTVLAARDYRDRCLIDEVVAVTPRLPDVNEIWDMDRWPADALWLDAAADIAISPQDTFVIQYTSGTTGTPKGAVLSHRACVAEASTMTPGLEPGDDEICCSPLPLHHIGALIAHALALASIAGTYVMLSDFSAPQFVEAAGQSRATMLGGVPTIYLRVLDEVPDVQLPDVRVLMLGGSSIPPALVSRLENHFDARVSVMYGQSEAPAISQTRLDDSASVKANTVGRALPYRELRIVSPTTGGNVDTGQIGEICVRTAIRMERYLHRPEATSAAIDEGGWLHTGDLGSLDGEGLLRFHGRLRDMIVRGGENIYARVVENAIEAHPDVAHAVVVGLPDVRWGESVAAAVVPRAGADLREEDLAAVVAQRLAHYKRPTRWHFVDDLPMTASGKPQKHKIIEVLMAADDN